MKKVAIVNGVVHQIKYNQHLAKHYAEIGYSVKEFNFPFGLLFRCEQHHRLDYDVKRIVEDSDVIHCQSGGFFPVLHYYYLNKHSKPIILETPVLQSTPGTLFAAMGWAKSYDKGPNSKLIQKALDTFCFTPAWQQSTIQRLQELKSRQLLLALASTSDNVSDNRGYEHLLHHHFSKGRHARLFYDNDFKVIHDFLLSHPHNHKDTSN